MTEPTGTERVEADLLFSPIVVNDVRPLESLKPHPTEITIQRGEKLEIKLELRGTLGPGEMFQDREVRLGTVSEGESTEAKSASGARTVLLHGITSTGSPVGSGERDFKDRGSLFRVIEEHQSGMQPHSTVMYLLGRPTAMILGSSEREFSGTEIRLHRPDYPEMGRLQTMTFSCAERYEEGVSSDCLLVRSKYGVVLFSEGAESDLTKRFQPSYLHFISGTGVQDEEARRSFLEAFNFAFGKRFVETGYTEFDESLGFIRRVSRSPFSYDLKREVLTPELPPATIHTAQYTNVIDADKVCKVVDLYLDSQIGLNLSEVMWRIWTARSMPLGQQLVVYGAALETLINAWYEKPENKARSVYVAKGDFRARTSEFLSRLRETVFPSEAESVGWKKVVIQLESANRLSLADQFKYFMSGLGLQSGGVETKLWEARNWFAHGNDIRDADSKRLVVLRRGYEALLNRCILRAIGFDGAYRDYSCLDFPETALETALGGPLGDGKV